MKEQRHIYYDQDLQIEAYNLKGIVQKFPNHFHEYYVIGFIEGGGRHLWCREREYDLHPGDLIIFNPRDCHCCSPLAGELLDYRALNIETEVMKRAVKEITGREYLPYFEENVFSKSESAPMIQDVYQAILEDRPVFEKEETFYVLLEQILKDCSVAYEEIRLNETGQQIKDLCEYIDQHFDEDISLDDLVARTQFGKSYLLRVFTKQVGVSPYRYLQNIRLKEAKELLQQGISPVEAAVTAGFSDQSHFTNFFKGFIGLTPKQYQRIFSEDANKSADCEEKTNNER